MTGTGDITMKDGKRMYERYSTEDGTNSTKIERAVTKKTNV